MINTLIYFIQIFYNRVYACTKNNSLESGLDVYSRVSSFISTLVRDCQQYRKAGANLDNVNVVIVTHGLSLRLFLMRWFQFSVEEFEETINPDNAQLVVLNKKCMDEYRWYELEEEHRTSLNLPEKCSSFSNGIGRR